MFPALMKNVFENFKNFKVFTLFEVGKVFFDESEKKRFAVIQTGEQTDFNQMKKTVVSIMKEMKIPPIRFERLSDDFLMGREILHPNKSAAVLCGKDKVSVLNYDILKSYITEPSLAEHIRGFEEQNGILFLLIGDEMVSITNNYSHPTFAN